MLKFYLFLYSVDNQLFKKSRVAE